MSSSTPRCSLGDERGSVLPLVLMTVVLLSALALALSSQTLLTRRVQDFDLDLDRGAYVARAGFERACAEVLLDADDWSTVTSPVFEGEGLGPDHYDVGVLATAPDEVTLEVVARCDEVGRTLRFVATRVSDAGGGTVGVRLDAVLDPSLDSLD